MGSRLNYTTIGIFVIFLGFAAIILPLWMTAGLSQKKYKTYVAYMNESVNGLSEQSPVKYNGVEVGYVKKIDLVPNNPQQVKLLLDLQEDVIVHEDATASLYTQGLTGLAYIGLKGGSVQAPILLAKSGSPYPVIETTPSLLFRLDTTIQKLSLSLTGLSDNLKEFFDEENQEKFQTILTNLEQVTSSAAAELPGLMTGLRKTTENAEQAMRRFNVEILPDSQQTIQQIQTLAQELTVTAALISENPSVIVRGRQMPRPGPGE